MNSRISLVLRTKNITPSQLADELGVQRSGISHILNGRNKPSLDFIQRIIKRYPDISMTWLMFGEGPMMNPYREKEELKGQDKKSAIYQSSIIDLFPPNDDLNENNESPEELSDAENSVNISEKQEVKSSSTINIQTDQKNVKLSAEHEIEDLLTENSPHIEKRAKESVKSKQISRIVIFYNDKSFVDYFPGEE